MPGLAARHVKQRLCMMPRRDHHPFAGGQTPAEHSHAGAATGGRIIRHIQPLPYHWDGLAQRMHHTYVIHCSPCQTIDPGYSVIRFERVDRLGQFLQEKSLPICEPGRIGERAGSLLCQETSERSIQISVKHEARLFLPAAMKKRSEDRGSQVAAKRDQQGEPPAVAVGPAVPGIDGLAYVSQLRALRRHLVAEQMLE